ncbi:dnaJ homolog subfamily C member 25 homolog [Ornithodoros turicata]
MLTNICFTVLLSISYVSQAQAFIEGLYCGKENCYDVLGVTRESSKGEISKAYRQLAKKYHPDVHRTQEAKDKAAEKFTLLATAYEILRDDESRKDYNDMLDDPDAIYRHYYRYYRKRVAPKVDIRIVLAVTITVISAVQYYGAWYRYRSAIDYLVTVPKYRIKAVDIAKKEGFYNASKKRDRRRKEEIKEEEENMLKKILEDQVDIRGGYRKPTLRNILWVQLVMLPYSLGTFLWWHGRWLWKFTLQRQELGMEERSYLIRYYMGLSQEQWDDLEDKDRERYFADGLWVKEKFLAWKKQQDEEMRAKLAESARYKSYRRYMKNHGPGQINFED